MWIPVKKKGGLSTYIAQDKEKIGQILHASYCTLLIPIESKLILKAKKLMLKSKSLRCILLHTKYFTKREFLCNS